MVRSKISVSEMRHWHNLVTLFYKMHIKDLLQKIEWTVAIPASASALQTCVSSCKGDTACLIQPFSKYTPACTLLLTLQLLFPVKTLMLQIEVSENWCIVGTSYGGKQAVLIQIHQSVATHGWGYQEDYKQGTLRRRECLDLETEQLTNAKLFLGLMVWPSSYSRN